MSKSDINLDYGYFMRNRDRFINLITFLEENNDISDENIAEKSVQEKITSGIGLYVNYNRHAMAYLENYIKSFGGVAYFRNTPLEIIAGDRATAIYLIQ